jgi:hypothetical protein
VHVGDDDAGSMGAVHVGGATWGCGRGCEQRIHGGWRRGAGTGSMAAVARRGAGTIEGLARGAVVGEGGGWVDGAGVATGTGMMGGGEGKRDDG